MLNPIKKNIVANYLGTIYITLIGVVMLPVYLEYMGAEAFGLVGFYTLLMSWLSLLVAGISPTMSREVAYYRGANTLWGDEFCILLRSIELLLILLAVITSIAVCLNSNWLAQHWLTVKSLPIDTVIYCLSLMAVTISIRWLTAFYSSIFNGMELQVWLNGFNSLFATLRYVAVYALLRWVSSDVEHFFDFQLVVAVVELLIVALAFYRTRPVNENNRDVGISFSLQEIKRLAPFAGGVAYTSMLWVLMTQSDKLVLSHVLTLSDYGHFSLIVIIANAVLLLSGPINQAVLPRMTKLFSQSNITAMYSLYRKSTQYSVIVAFSVAGVLSFFSKEAIFVLTGNQAISVWGTSILAWFVLGNAILVIAGMQFVLQYVHGKVRMHVVNTSINALVQVPILAFIAFNYGPVAVAKAWFMIRLVTFFIWPPLVHQKFAPGLHLTWLKVDVLPPLFGVFLTLAVIYCAFSVPIAAMQSRVILLLVLGVVGLVTLLVSSLFASEVRSEMARKLAGFRHA